MVIFFPCAITTRRSRRAWAKRNAAFPAETSVSRVDATEKFCGDAGAAARRVTSKHHHSQLLMFEHIELDQVETNGEIM
jgi:hypothetical protein